MGEFLYGNYILKYMAMGCDVSSNDSSTIIKINRNGNVIWKTDGIEDDYSSFPRYKNGYLVYAYSYATHATSWLFIDQNGNKRNYTDLPSQVIGVHTLSNDSILLLEQQPSNQFSLKYTDTLGHFTGNFYWNEPTFYDSILITSKPGDIAVATGRKFFVLNDDLSLRHDTVFSTSIIHLKYDNTGTLWMLLKSGILLKFDTSFHNTDSINLLPLIQSEADITWFDFDIAKDLLWIGGNQRTYQNTRPFVKTFELSSLQNFLENHQVKVLSVQRGIISSHVSYLGATYPFISVNYWFPVTARIKNTGSTFIESVFLNCTAPRGFYNCKRPYFSNRIGYLNLMPGDSVEVQVGIYKDRDGSFYPGDTLIPLFCVWPSAPNEAWDHNIGNSTGYCLTNVNISDIPGLGFNEPDDSRGIKLFPVPATDQLSIQFPENSGPWQLTAYNAVGSKQLIDYSVNTNNCEINLLNLTAGIYILELTDGKHTVRKKLLKN